MTAAPVVAGFTGTSPREYPQFLDEGGTGVTLAAEPQAVYTVGNADQWDTVMQALPGDGLWVLAQTKPEGFAAIPGLAISGMVTPAWSGTGEADIIIPPDPGSGTPGPASIAAVTAATFTGTSLREYPQFLDAGNGGITLVAKPRTTYLVTNADQWANGPFPGDGLWLLGTVSPAGGFTAVPGLAVTGLSSPGWPGGTSHAADASVFRGVLDAAALEDALPLPANPGLRVITGRPRKLPPVPHRRRHPRRVRTRTPAGR